MKTNSLNEELSPYADYMQTPEFEQKLDELVQLANRGQIALMCAEAMPCWFVESAPRTA